MMLSIAATVCMAAFVGAALQCSRGQPVCPHTDEGDVDLFIGLSCMAIVTLAATLGFPLMLGFI